MPHKYADSCHCKHGVCYDYFVAYQHCINMCVYVNVCLCVWIYMYLSIIHTCIHTLHSCTQVCMQKLQFISKYVHF